MLPIELPIELPTVLPIELHMNGKDSLPGTGAFVAAFASTNLGDVSPNTAGIGLNNNGLWPKSLEGLLAPQRNNRAYWLHKGITWAIGNSNTLYYGFGLFGDFSIF